MANTHDLPQEILVEIFSKLPTKSVGKCKCLSKTWNTYLSTSQFIKLHLNRETHHQQNLILVTRHQSFQVITSPAKNDNHVSRERKIQLPITWPTAASLLGSCNGLVLLSGGNQKLVLNRITHQQAIIPDSALGFWNEKDHPFRSYGFGYDHACDDYKVVTLSLNRDVPREDIVLDVYSVRQCVTKRVGTSHFRLPYYINNVMPFVNDSVHLFTTTESGICIGAFNLVSETFQEVPLPKDFQPKYVYSALVIFGGCLCIVDQLNDRYTEIWIMKEYGVVGSWLRFGVNRNNFMWCTRFRPLCFVGHDKLLSLTGGATWVVRDLKTGSMKEVFGKGISSSDICDWGSFIDTLVSPKRYPSF